jgi:hypothetical protein
MPYRKIYFTGFVLPLFLFSACLHSRTTAPSFTIVVAELKISYGNAIVKIDGKINKNLYYGNMFDNQMQDEKYYDNPAIMEGTITKNASYHRGGVYVFYIADRSCYDEHYILRW